MRTRTAPQTTGLELLSDEQRQALTAYSGTPTYAERLDGEPSSPGRRAVKVTLTTGWTVKLGQHGAVIDETAPTEAETAERQRTTAAGLDAAGEIFAGDWDEHATSTIHLPRDLAEQLLEARGWTMIESTRRDGTHYWIAPSRPAFDGRDWTHAQTTSEALQYALAAEAAR